MKNYSIALLALISLAVAGCGKKAGIVCTVKQAPENEFTVRQLNMNVYDILDTVKSDRNGVIKYSINLESGQPEFIYLFRGEKQVAALLLEAGENAVVEADTTGNYTVSGSEGSSKLKEVNDRFAAFMLQMRQDVAAADNKAASQHYVNYYRESVKYILSNPYSLTVIPVLYQQINESSPIFSQSTDAIYFRRACDSLKTVYPDSKYVKALESETARREKVLSLNASLDQARESGFPDISIADINGNKVALSSVDAKVILLYFWTAADAEQRIVNTESLMPLYKEFHSKGFEIYSVCVDVDKAEWASCIRSQELPWINVNDGLGVASNALALYNVATLPATFIIVDGELTGISSTSEAEFRRELAGLLK